MTRRSFAAAFAAAALALTIAAAAPRPAHAVSFVDKQVQAGGLLIQNYVNAYGMNHGFLFPAKSMVKKGGGLEDGTRIWPSNPWTGKLMAPGTSRGTYTYALRNAGTAYTLTMHLSSGNYAFKASMPRWLKTERDVESRQSLLLLQRYVEASATNTHLYPATGTFTKDGYPAGTWPVNPWTGAAMELGPGLGDFSYTQKNGGAGYELKVHRAFNGDFVLVQLPVGVLVSTTPGP